MDTNIKKINRKLRVNTYIVTFSYETYKGYYREQQRIIKGFSKEEVKEFLKDWVNSTRTMSNVKILGIEKQEEYTQEIDI